MRIAVLAGLLVFALPGIPAALLLREDGPPPVAKAAPPPVVATPAPGWNHADRASLRTLRAVSVEQARHVISGLRACERRAARDAKPAVRYHRCARPALARADGSGTANGRMLAVLVNTSAPTAACRERILQLSGSSGNLGMTANATLRGGIGAPWDELLAASQTIRELARETSRLARRPGWGKTCAPKPPARAPAAPEA